MSSSASVKLDAPLVRSATAPLSRAEFWRRVHGLADALAPRQERRWALVCEDSAWFAAGFMALAGSGRVVVLPQAPQAGSLAASAAAVDAVLTDHPEDFEGYSVLPATGVYADLAAESRLPPDGAAVEFYTSGSSGMPKRVPKAYAQLRLEVEALERQWGPRLGAATMVGTVPHYHLYGVLFRILWPLLTGRSFLRGMCLQPAALGEAALHGDCAIVSSPAFLGRIADYTDLPSPSKVRAVFSSGALLPDDAARPLAEQWGKPAIEVYGSTETGGIAWRAWSGPHERALWTPIVGVETDVREEPAGPRLWVRSGCTWNGDWAPTGDHARRREHGFELLGRADDVVKLEDKRISLTEMRARLLQHAWVADARLLLLDGRRRCIGAVVILSPMGNAALARGGKVQVNHALRDSLRTSYEALLVPRKWRYVDSLPGNDMGKVERARLEQLFEAKP